MLFVMLGFFFSSRRRHTRFSGVMEFRRVLFRSASAPAAWLRLAATNSRKRNGLWRLLWPVANTAIASVLVYPTPPIVIGSGSGHGSVVAHVAAVCTALPT